MPQAHGKIFDHNKIWFKQIRPDVIIAEKFEKRILVYTVKELNDLLINKADKTGQTDNDEYIALISENEGNLVNSNITIEDVLMVGVADGGTF